METGLKYLLKGDIIKMDIFRALLDHETEEEVSNKAKTQKGFDPNDYLRYSVINTSLLLVGLTAKNAGPMKAYLGSTAYTLSCIVELIKREKGLFDVEIDDGKEFISNLNTQYLQIYNGKTGGGRIILNPIGMINDGFMELVYRPAYVGPHTAISLFMKPGGIMFYDEGFTCYRCKKVKLINKKKNQDGSNAVMDINIDGEDLTFTNFAKYEVLKGELDVIVDF